MNKYDKFSHWKRKINLYVNENIEIILSNAIFKISCVGLICWKLTSEK